MEVQEACYKYGFLPADRGRQWHQPPPPPLHPAPAVEAGELWEYFPCPFCYIEVEVPFLCNHLQEEHCFDTRNAVCPICANNLGRDMAAHFRVEHSHLLKRRKPCKPFAWPPPQAASGFQEPQQQHLGRRQQRDQPAPDPLLSHFICTTTSVEVEVEVEHTHTHHHHHHHPDDASRRADDDDASSKLGLQERLQRIDFLTELLMSTIL